MRVDTSRTATVIAVLLVGMMVVAAQNASARPETTTLTAYLSAVRPIVVGERRAFSNASVAADQGSVIDYEGKPEFQEEVWAEARRIRGFASKLRRVKAPAQLRGPHSALATSMMLRAAIADDMGNELQAERDLLDQKPVVQSHELRRHWRDEVTVALRRARLAVPLWVKQTR